MSEHEQTAALRLADNLENLEATGSGGDYFVLTEWSQRRALEAASELRRLDAENKAFMNLLRRAQPAQAGQVLTDDRLLAMWEGTDGERALRPTLGKNKILSFARAIEQAVLAKCSIIKE